MFCFRPAIRQLFFDVLVGEGGWRGVWKVHSSNHASRMSRVTNHASRMGRVSEWASLNLRGPMGEPLGPGPAPPGHGLAMSHEP